MLLFVLIAKNLARTRTGRALQAIRDRDIAAEVMGVAEFKYKIIAFAIVSFFAGIAGALLRLVRRARCRRRSSACSCPSSSSPSC